MFSLAEVRGMSASKGWQRPWEPFVTIPSDPAADLSCSGYLHIAIGCELQNKQSFKIGAVQNCDLTICRDPQNAIFFG